MSTDRFAIKRITDPANRLGLIGAGLLAATLAFGVYQAVPILKAIRAGGGSATAADGSEAVLKFASTLKNDESQINGRSFFFDPPPPPPPPEPKREEPKREDPRPEPIRKPTSYGGPKVVGTAIDTVWFDNNKTMRVGGPLESEMRIISISTAPYVVRIEWKEVEFDVPFLPRDSVVDKSRPAPPPDPTPPPATAPTTPPATSPGTTPATTPAAPKPGDAPATPSTSPAPGDKKDEKKEEPKPADAPKPAGDSPATPPVKEDGST